MHADQLAPLIALAAKKGVTDLVPGWLRPGVCAWYIKSGDPLNMDNYTDLPDADSFIVTGSLAKWLAGQGWAVYGYGDEWFRSFDGRMKQRLRTATDFLSALIAAATARLNEMPDAAGGAESPAASKEGGRQ
jgi:hypothetical protein